MPKARPNDCVFQSGRHPYGKSYTEGIPYGKG